MKKTKILLIMACAVLLVAASVMGTMAYLTSTDTVTNTFTVGQVKIKLEEHKVGDDGKMLTGNNAEFVKENSYKLMPGHTYDKDPTVTVLAGSEESYIKMVVTVDKASELDKIFKDHNITDLTTVIKGYDATAWILKNTSKDTTANTRTYVFYYKKTVSAPEGNAQLQYLFNEIDVPSGLTNEEIATINEMTITIKAYAIQADGFANADAAWAAFPNN